MDGTSTSPQKDKEALMRDLRLFGGTATIGAGFIGLQLVTISLTGTACHFAGVGRWRGPGVFGARARRMHRSGMAGHVGDGPGGWTPRAHAMWVEYGAILAKFAELIACFPVWAGVDNPTGRKFNWVVWGLDAFWWLGSTGIRIYKIRKTTGTDNSDFMMHTYIGGFEFGVAIVKFFVNFLIWYFEDFQEGKTSNLRWLRILLQFLDGGCDIACAGTYMVPASTGSTRKDASVTAEALMYVLKLAQLFFKSWGRKVDWQIQEEEEKKGKRSG